MRLRLDWGLVVLVALLFALGLAALYSAGGEGRFWTQLWRGALGGGVMLGVALLPQAWMRRAAVALFVIGLAMLAAVLVAGIKINNARRWLYFGFFVQPSELMKIALPLALAYGYSLTQTARWWHHLLALAVAGLPVLLVLQQPDFGTSALIAVAGVSTVFFAGIGKRWVAGFCVAGVAALPLFWSLLKPYQQKRVLTMLDPYQDPLGAGYHTIQSQIAVGSGGVWGKGFLNGTQAQLGFLPERHTDFIFAVFAEEFGLMGAMAMLALGVLILWRCLLLAGRARALFGYLAAAAIATVFFFTFVVNISMVSGLLPVVGMPLPLVSYGGTALLATFAGFGVVLSVARDSAKEWEGR